MRKLVLTGFLFLILFTGLVAGFESGTEGGDSESGYQEEVIYDLQAGWAFQESGSIGDNFMNKYGSSIVRENESGVFTIDEDVGATGEGNSIVDAYIENAGNNWGGGNPTTTSTDSGDIVVNDPRTGGSRLIYGPHPDYGNADDRCGSEISTVENQIDCPEDSGLPDQSGTDQQVSSTITDNVNQFSIESPVGNTHTDNVDNDFSNFQAEEFHTEDYIGGDYYWDVTGKSDDLEKKFDSDTAYTDGYSDSQSFEWSDIPSFYTPDGQSIKAVYLGLDQQSTSITGYRKVGEVESEWIDENTVDTTESDSVSTCDDSGSNYTSSLCEDTGNSIWSDRSSVQDRPTSIPLETVEKSITGSSTTYEASSTSDGGYNRETTSRDIEINVDTDASNTPTSYETQYETSGIQIDGEQIDMDAYNDCTSSSTYYDCTVTTGYDNGYVTDEGGLTYEIVKTHNVEVYIQELEWEEQEVFNLDPAQNPGSVINNVREALFKGAGFDTPYGITSWEDIVAVSDSSEGIFFTPAGDGISGRFMDSDRSVSATTFELGIDGDDNFISDWDSVEVFKADSEKSLADGYVAVRHGVAWNERMDSGKNYPGSPGGSDDYLNIDGVSPGMDSSSDYAYNPGFSGDYESILRNRLQDRDFDCPNDSVYCVVAVDYHMDNLGTANENNVDTNWDVDNPMTGADFNLKSQHTSETLGVCELYQSISTTSNDDLDDSENLQCQYNYNRGGGGSNPPSECNEAYNRWHTMEGPEVDEDAMENSEKDLVKEHLEACVEENECVLHGNAVPEGTVDNVAWNESFSGYPGYEEGGDSPDGEVCLNVNEKEDYHTFGGQWYDLDNPIVGEYLRDETTPDSTHTDFEGNLIEGEASDLVNSPQNTRPSEGEDNITKYWMENPFPQHPKYNPSGGMEGTSLIPNCAPTLDGCAEDNTTDNGRGGLYSDKGYFSFFEEYSMDDDYHPQGLREYAEVSSFYEGTLTLARKADENSQLDPSNPDYSVESPTWFENTVIENSDGSYNATAMAYAPNETWTVSSAGVPYPAYSSSGSIPSYASDSGNHYNESFTGNKRNDPGDNTVSKNEKAFGNSLAVIASNNANYPNVQEGDGFWIDPDNIREHVNEGNLQNFNAGDDSWRDLVDFQIDLTGPDSGLGWDYGYHYDNGDGYFTPSNDANIGGSPAPSAINFSGGSTVAYTDIHWEQDSSGNRLDSLQPPMCGDDSSEFFLEEMGESNFSEKFEGRYACATQQNYCVSYEGSGGRLYDEGEYLNTNELGETEGRLKADEEVCVDTTSADFLNTDQSIWLDQDYSSKQCRENDLYGGPGTRWIDYSQINDNPLAFNDGVDDSWNPEFDRRNHDSLQSNPNGSEWSLGDDIIGDGYTPISTGISNYTVPAPQNNGASYGFCGGDDASEYLIYQDSQTERVETDQSVIAVSSSPDSCVLDNSRFNGMEDSDVNKGAHEGNLAESELKDTRMTYSEGESVTFDSGDTRRTIQCFDGQWWGEWPIVFYEETERFDIGQTGYIPFNVINPTEGSVELDLDLNPRGDSDERSDLNHITSFEASGEDELALTVPAQSSVTQRLEVAANREIDTTGDSNHHIAVIGESTDGSLEGEDQVDMVINESASLEASGSNIRDIPGLTFIQLIFIALASTMMFVFRN